MSDDLSDQELMTRIANGDEDSLRILIDRHKKAVYGTILKMIGDATESEDLAQRVFLRVYQSSSRYEAKAQFKTWLMTIVKNIVFNEYRRRKRKPWESLFDPETNEPREFSDPIQSPPDLSLQREELRQTIDQSISQLPDKQRLAIILNRCHEMSYEEIAASLKISIASTKSLLFRARETLKEILQKKLQL